MPRSVDESLFGSKKSKRGLRRGGSSVVSSKPATAIISSSMLETIRNRALGEDAPSPVSSGRKTHTTRSGKAIGWLPAKRPDPKVEYAKTRRGNAAVARSMKLRDGELDEIKTLQSDIMRYQTMTTLLEQKEAKKRAKAEEAQREADWHYRMDTDRKRAVIEREEKERRRRAEALVMKEALMSQIAARERQRLVEADQLEQEKEHALRMIQQGLADDRRKAEELEEDRRRMALQLKRDNDEGLALKRLEIAKEIETDRLIEEWSRRKEAKEAALAFAKAEEKRLKDAEFAKMLASQSRTLDKQADEDEKRAKRNQEMAALADEARLAADQKKKAGFLKEVMDQRDAQMRLKRAKELEERRLDMEFARQVKAAARESDETQARKDAARTDFLMTHGALLKQQIAGRAEERVVAKQRELDETYMRLVTDEVHALRVKQAALERIEAHNATGCAPLPVHATAKVLGITAKKVFNEQKRSRALW